MEKQMDEIEETVRKCYCDANKDYLEKQLKIASEYLTEEQKKELLQRGNMLTVAGDMLTVFMNRAGDILFTYPNVDLRRGDRVKFHGKIYLVVQKTFNVSDGCYEVLLHESEETE